LEVEMVRMKLVGRGLEDGIGCSEIGFGCLRRGDESDQLMILTFKSIEMKEYNQIGRNSKQKGSKGTRRREEKEIHLEALAW